MGGSSVNDLYLQFTLDETANCMEQESSRTKWAAQAMYLQAQCDEMIAVINCIMTWRRHDYKVLPATCYICAGTVIFHDIGGFSTRAHFCHEVISRNKCVCHLRSLSFGSSLAVWFSLRYLWFQHCSKVIDLAVGVAHCIFQPSYFTSHDSEFFNVRLEYVCEWIGCVPFSLLIEIFDGIIYWFWQVRYLVIAFAVGEVSSVLRWYVIRLLIFVGDVAFFDRYRMALIALYRLF